MLDGGGGAASRPSDREIGECDGIPHAPAHNSNDMNMNIVHGGGASLFGFCTRGARN